LSAAANGLKSVDTNSISPSGNVPSHAVNVVTVSPATTAPHPSYTAP
jgi:hypothetical protein